jgi:hypothetical protein
LLNRRHYLARFAFKSDAFKDAAQVAGGATVAVEIDLFALRQPPFKLLKLTLKRSGSLA